MLYLNLAETNWAGAFNRAIDRQPDHRVSYTGTVITGCQTLTVFQVASATHAVDRYRVELRRYASGHIEIGCDCPSRHACWHRAAALNRYGLLLAEDVAA